jgi:WD40 repeat protein
MKKILLTLLLATATYNFLLAQETKLMLPIGHTLGINSARFSPDGRRVVTTSDDKTAKIWDVKLGTVVHSLNGNLIALIDAIYSPDGKTILTLGEYDSDLIFKSNYKIVKIWDATTGLLINDLVYYIDSVGHGEEAVSAFFSPDGKHIITASISGNAKIWNARTGKIIHTLEGHSTFVNFAKFSLDNKLAISVSGDNTAKIWEVQTGKLLRTLAGHTETVVNADFSSDAVHVATISNDGNTKIWDLTTGQLLKNLKQKSPNHFDSTKYSAAFEKQKVELNKVVFSPDGQSIATTINNGFANVWDVNSGGLRFIIDTGLINSIAFSPDNTMLLISAADSTAKVWSPKTGVVLFDLNVNKKKDKVVYASFSPDGKQIITAYADNTSKVWDVTNRKLMQKLEGHTKFINSIKYSPDGKSMLAVYENSSVKVWNVKTGQLKTSFKFIGVFACEEVYCDFSDDGKKIMITRENCEMSSGKLYTLYAIIDAENGSRLLSASAKQKRSFALSPNMNTYTSVSKDSSILIKDLISRKNLQTLRGKSKKIYYFIKFSPDAKSILAASYDNSVDVWDVTTGNLSNTFQGVKGDVVDAIFSAKTTVLSFTKTDESSTFYVWDVSNNKLLGEKTDSWEGIAGGIASSFFLTPKGKKIVFNYVSSEHANLSTDIWNAETKESTNFAMLSDMLKISNFSSDEQKIVFISEDTLRFINGNSTLEQKLPMPFGTKLGDVSYENNQFSLSINSEVQLYSLDKKELLLSFVAIDSTDWAVIHPSGLFDASPNAMEKMYWKKGDELIALNQLKDRYWQPNLWSMIMSGKHLRSVEGMNNLKLQPEVEVSEIKNDLLLIKLKKRSGGYGKVSVYINNKEVIEDARPQNFDKTQQFQTITINTKTHPEFKDHLIGGIKNIISVKVQSEDGFLSSRGEELISFSDEPQTKPKKPAFYAVICGTGEYSNTLMNLKYPVIDAQSIEKAITLGANNLFGKDNTHVYLLSSRGDATTATTKQNIQKTFENIKAKAKPEDIVMVYLSGHGVTYGGEKGDFYYLTTDYSGTSAESFADPALRKSQSISTEEFTDWLNDIPALKQIMIIDACGSGKAVDNLIARRDTESSQIKAIDRMKDRTGLYVLSGCAANAVSYEANRFGQGLLTYSVLQAMRGMALRENKYVDITTLLSYSSEEVPKMAKDIGGIQKPQLLMPKGGSFDIGIIQESDKAMIPLATVKPVFVRTTLLEETKKRDVLKLSKDINNKLNDISGRGDEKNAIIFVDTDDYPEACSISGSYTMVGEMLNFSGSILCGKTEKNIKIENVSKEKLIERIVAEALNK